MMFKLSVDFCVEDINEGARRVRPVWHNLSWALGLTWRIFKEKVTPDELLPEGLRAGPSLFFFLFKKGTCIGEESGKRCQDSESKGVRIPPFLQGGWVVSLIGVSVGVYASRTPWQSQSLETLYAAGLRFAHANWLVSKLWQYWSGYRFVRAYGKWVQERIGPNRGQRREEATCEILRGWKARPCVERTGIARSFSKL